MKDTTTLLRMLLMGALATGAIACGGDEEEETDAGQSETGDNETGGNDVTDDTDGSNEETGGNAGFCLGAADLAIIESTDADPTTEGDQTVTGVAQSCGLGCLGDDDPTTCSVGCITEKTGVSGDCAGCYGGVVACSIANCLASCATNPSGEACTSCQAEFCLGAFYECTGLEAPEPVDPDATDDTTETDAGDDTTEADAGDDTTETDAGDDTTETDAGDDTSESDAGDDTTESDTTEPTEGCDNASDLALLDDEGASIIGCYTECEENSDLGACVTACMAELGVSDSCSGCIGGLGVCLSESCATECEDPATDGCAVCIEANCAESFFECSGYSLFGDGGGSGEGSGGI